jgi:hypothetical protein
MKRSPADRVNALLSHAMLDAQLCRQVIGPGAAVLKNYDAPSGAWSGSCRKARPFSAAWHNV